ncbi:MAG: methyltransferase family protein [Opitutaceae bacterium]
MQHLGIAFVALWVFWAVYWIAAAFGNKRPMLRVSLLWRFAGMLSIAAAFFVLHRYPHYFGRRILPRDGARAAAGLVLTAGGIAFAIWARRVLGRNWSAEPTIKEDHELIRRGPYRRIRHPIYTGLLVAIFGSCLAEGRRWDAYLLALAIVLLVAKLKIEEALMFRRFPTAYRKYRKRTAALIPFVY